MNNSYNEPKDINIDFIDYLWKLLMQWKVILIFCIAMAILVPGVKYLSDSKAYNAELANLKKIEDESSMPADERIEATLKSLPADQRSDVLFVVQQQAMVDAQKKYLNESVLLNTDPANERQLAIKYIVKSDVGTDMRALADAYSTCLRRKEYLEQLGNLISPDTKLDYINELIDTENEDILAGDSESAIYTVTITILDDTDADKIVSLIDSAISNLHRELNTSVGGHTITIANAEDQAVFNEDISNRRASLNSIINNLKSSIDNAKGSLSPEQQAAVETIIAINQSVNLVQDASSESSTSVSAPQKPGISIKYAIFGFMLGMILYAGIYLLVLILHKYLSSARTAQHYINNRLLGEIYTITEHKGFSRMFASEIVAKWRYRDKLDLDRQIKSTVMTLDAVCTNNMSDEITLLLTGISSEFNVLIRQIVDRCTVSEAIKKIDIINTDAMDEKAMISISNSVYVVSHKTPIDRLGQIMSLSKDYNVTSIGTIYLEDM